MSRLIFLTVLTVFVDPAFSQYQNQIQPIQRACDLRNCQCPQSYQPFCGTDGITYGNKCSLECAQRQCNSNVRVKFEGVCPEKYVHNDGSSNSQTAESRKNFAVIRPPVNYRPESPTNSFGRYPATIPTTRRTTTNYFEYGTTDKPTSNYVQYGTTRRATTNYFQYEPTKKSTPNYFEYITTTRRPPTNYFEYSTSTRRPTFEYGTTPRPYGARENNNAYGGNGQGNDQRSNQYNQNQYGDFYDY